MTKKSMLLTFGGILGGIFLLAAFALYKSSTICGSSLTKTVAEKFKPVIKGFGIVGLPHNPTIIRGFQFNEEDGTSFSFDYSEGPLSGGGLESIEQVEVKDYTVDNTNGIVRADVTLGKFTSDGSGFKFSLKEAQLNREGEIKPRKEFDVRKNCRKYIKKLSKEEAKEVRENLRKIAAGEKGDAPTFLWQLEE